MRRFRRLPHLTRFTATALLLAYLPACHVWRAEAVAPQAVIESQHPGKLRVTRADGSRQVLHRPTITQDSLTGAADEGAVPLSDVRKVETRHGSAGRTILFVGAGVVGGLLAAAVIVCASDCSLNFGH